MGHIADRSGQRFGRLTILGLSDRQGRHIMWLCRCDCGNTTPVQWGNLSNGHTRSCGCLYGIVSQSRDRTAPDYQMYRDMHNRCENPESKPYPDYGGRGIRVCERWSGPEGYRNFLADMGRRPAGLSLDRIDNDGPYSPDNCRWATTREQVNNRRVTIKIDGVPLSVWSERLGIAPSTLRRRWQRGVRGDHLFRQPRHPALSGDPQVK